jgi:hypothetical protein
MRNPDGAEESRANRAYRFGHDRANQTPEPIMTSPAPDPRPSPEPFPHPEPKPANPDETPVEIIDLPPNQPSPGVPVDKPAPM